ncbi:hypothetical protein ZTR_10489 [Talaromyces verruculosus]|nr:hypothetical protein ZTR_10489 [Talaromyces verruculosus]
MAPRGRGGKFSKPTRGGGKHFSRDVQPLDKDGNPLGMWRDPEDEPSSEEDDDSSSEEEESSEDGGAPGPSKVAPEEMTPDAAPPKKSKNTEQLSRREREALEAQQARERYMKLHMEGKTDEARADMERLRLVRERREAEKARREAEKEEREAQQKARQDEITEREKKLREAALGKSAKGGKKGAKK